MNVFFTNADTKSQIGFTDTNSDTLLQKLAFLLCDIGFFLSAPPYIMKWQPIM